MGNKNNGYIAKALQFVTVDIWSLNVKKITGFTSKLIRVLQITVLVTKDFMQKRFVEKASALTYYTILSLVPIIAMAFGFAKGFGFDKDIENYLITLFADKQDIVDMILEFSESLLARTQGGLIAGFGIILLLWSVIKMMSYIESTFNEIWSVTKQRSMTRKLSDYLTIVLLAPILLIISYSTTSFITETIAGWAESIAWVQRFNGLLSFGMHLLSYSLLWLAFAMLYMVMPNTKVQIQAALISGIVTGIAFQITQYIYFTFQIGVSNYNAIYGSFAAIPLFLVWLQTSWTIILIGAGIAYAIQNVTNFEYEIEVTQISHSLKTKLAMLTLHSIAVRFKNGEPPQSSHEISEAFNIPQRIIKLILQTLVNAELIREVKTGEEKSFAYVPAFTIDAMDVESCIKRIMNTGIQSIEIQDEEQFNKIAAIVDSISLSENKNITEL